MTFTYDVTNDIGKIRLYVGDVNEGASTGVRADGSNFSDEELTTLLGQEDNDWHRACAAVCEILAVEWARVADVTVGPRREALSSVSKRYTALAAAFRGSYGGGGANTAFVAGLKREDGYSEAAAGEVTS